MVEVGQAKIKFHVHEALLCHNSQWFANRLNGNWGDTKLVELADEDPAIFDIFVDTLYRNQVPPPKPTSFASFLATTSASDAAPPPNPSTNHTDEAAEKRRKSREGHHPAMTLAKLYVFADMRQCPQVKCLVMDAYRDRRIVTGDVDWSVMKYIYENTPARCGFRRFSVDAVTKHAVGAKYWTTDGLKDLANRKMPAELLQDLVVALYKTRNEPAAASVWWKNQSSADCDYHDHDA